MKVIFLTLIFVMSVSAMTLEKAEDRLDYLESTLNSTIDLLRLLTCQQCSSRGTEDCINGYCVSLEGYTGPTCSGTGKLTLISFILILQKSVKCISSCDREATEF